MRQVQPGGFKILPPIVKNLLIINGLVYLGYISIGQAFNYDLNDEWGLHFFLANKFNPFQFLTYMFLHGSFLHLFSNMFALWMFGSVIENVWGGKRFLIYYLITGFGAALIHYGIASFDVLPAVNAVEDYLKNPSPEAFLAFRNSEYFSIFSYEVQDIFNDFVNKYNFAIINNPDKADLLSLDFMLFYKEALLNAPVVVGASGAVFGILLAFGMLFPNTIIYLYFAIPVKAKYFVIFYGLFELYAGFQNNPTDNVAHFAHLGGMVFGFLLIRYWRKKRQI